MWRSARFSARASPWRRSGFQHSRRGFLLDRYGYTVIGYFSYSSSLSGLIIGSQLDSFFVQIDYNGSPVGSRGLSSGYTGYEFNFKFNAATLTFSQGGFSGGPTGQDWDDVTFSICCPDPGVGFSSGSSSQGVCVNDGRFVGSGTNHNIVASPGDFRGARARRCRDDVDWNRGNGASRRAPEARK
ncbi:MAG TPA: hypothetical protein VIY49_25765 [Bryobacteraceae bacterium]